MIFDVPEMIETLLWVGGISFFYTTIAGAAHYILLLRVFRDPSHFDSKAAAAWLAAFWPVTFIIVAVLSAVFTTVNLGKCIAHRVVRRFQQPKIPKAKVRK